MTAPSSAHLADLATRWEAAREAALAAPDSEQLRRIFDNSLRLGRGFARLHGAPVAPEVLPQVLVQLGAPCLLGRWSDVEDEAGFWLDRSPCERGATAGFCDRWREAINGLVLGLTDGVRHARHQSAGHASDRCIDVFYADPESSLRYGELTAELTEGLESVRRLVHQFRGGADVAFLGVCEGELLYQLRAPRGEAGGCGSPSAGPLKQIVERCLHKHFPALTARELSARPVLDAGEPSP